MDGVDRSTGDNVTVENRRAFAGLHVQ